MVNYQRAHDDDVDFIPLMTAPAPEQDITEPHLPTYDEVLSDHETQAAPQRTGREQALPTEGQAIAAALAKQNPTQFRRLVQRGKWGLICMALSPGIGLTIGAVVGYNYLPKLG
jgi:hypothetical protein